MPTLAEQWIRERREEGRKQGRQEANELYVRNGFSIGYSIEELEELISVSYEEMKQMLAEKGHLWLKEIREAGKQDAMVCVIKNAITMGFSLKGIKTLTGLTRENIIHLIDHHHLDKEDLKLPES